MFVTLEFQKQDCNISTLLFQEGEHQSPAEFAILLPNISIPFDGCGILLPDVRNSLITCSSRCTCRSLVQTVVRLTEVMQLLKHLAEALHSLQSCCQTSLDIGCTQVWNLSQMHLSTFPKGMWALLDCSGTALRWSR